MPEDAPSGMRLSLPDGRQPLIFTWGVSSFFGWGLNGLNLSLALSTHPSLYPIAARPFDLADVVIDPLRQQATEELRLLSAPLWDAIAAHQSPVIGIDAPVLTGLGNDLVASPLEGRRLVGQPNIAVAFFETATLSREARARAETYALIVAGSTWNESMLRAHDIIATTTVLQGVDTSLFHPAPRTGRFRGRFVVFSGGKLEYRKGQDLVVRAFRAFHQRHPEALLLTAWASPWYWRDEGFPAATGTAALNQSVDGLIDTARWAIESGVPADALIALGRTPNIAMAHVIREADVALFPSRCEGGTNLPAMECMACGIPVILSANTGHLDLLTHQGAALPLTRQTQPEAAGYHTVEWGESDIEEIVEHLETVWRHRDHAAAIGGAAADYIAPMTWQRQTARLLRAITPFLP